MCGNHAGNALHSVSIGVCLCDSVYVCLLSWRFGEVQSAIASSAMKSHIDSSKDSLEESKEQRDEGNGGRGLHDRHSVRYFCSVCCVKRLAR